MLRIDQGTLEITCPSGDTGIILARMTASDGTDLNRDLEGVAVFAICQAIRSRGSYTTIAQRVVDIVDNEAVIVITNAFSRALTPGSYHWDIRVVTNPEYDEDGNIQADDDTDEVHSLFAGRKGGMPKYTVPGVAVDV